MTLNEETFLATVHEILDDDSIQMDTSVADAGADSLDLIELVTTVEERYGVFLDQSELANLETPRQFYNLVQHHSSEGITGRD